MAIIINFLEYVNRTKKGNNIKRKKKEKEIKRKKISTDNDKIIYFTERMLRNEIHK